MRRNRIDSAVCCYQIPPFVGMLMEQSNSFQRIQSPMEFVPERSLLLPPAQFFGVERHRAGDRVSRGR
jgi:hypothetical protein